MTLKLLTSLCLAITLTHQQEAWGPKTRTSQQHATGPKLTIESVQFKKTIFPFTSSTWIRVNSGMSRMQCFSRCMETDNCVAISHCVNKNNRCRTHSSVFRAQPKISRINDDYTSYEIKVSVAFIDSLHPC